MQSPRRPRSRASCLAHARHSHAAPPPLAPAAPPPRRRPRRAVLPAGSSSHPRICQVNELTPIRNLTLPCLSHAAAAFAHRLTRARSWTGRRLGMQPCLSQRGLTSSPSLRSAPPTTASSPRPLPPSSAPAASALTWVNFIPSPDDWLIW